MENKNQKIKCNVTNCEYNNDANYLCKLDEINVSCTCNQCDCKKKKETICDSFKERN